jgi:ubiquinone/menaquinone biosynthesis C-methylase UbiE
MIRVMPTTHGHSESGLRRSFRLFRDFLHEQDDPARFYGALASDSVAMVEEHCELMGQRVLDVGAGPLYFARAFEGAGAAYIACDVDVVELADVAGGWGAVAGRAQQLPFADASIDIAFSSNVLEHVSDPELMCSEMIRVTRPGGLVVLSFTNWLSPWGGHETAPWHYLGGDFAARRYEHRWGHPPKNRFGKTLFRISIAQMTQMVSNRGDADVLDMRPRYLPSWARPLVRVAGLRELLTWNLWIVLRRR